jgi:hypothetical protein
VAEGEQLRTPLCPHTWQALARPIVTDGVGAAVVAAAATVVGVGEPADLTAVSPVGTLSVAVEEGCSRGATEAGGQIRRLQGHDHPAAAWEQQQALAVSAAGTSWQAL